MKRFFFVQFACGENYIDYTEVLFRGVSSQACLQWKIEEIRPLLCESKYGFLELILIWKPGFL